MICLAPINPFQRERDIRMGSKSICNIPSAQQEKAAIIIPQAGVQLDSKNLQLRIKYTLDRIAAAFILVILLPVLAVIYLAVRLDSKGPGFFTQKRVGLNGKEFTIYKFRTMVQNAENIASGIIIDGKDDPRITRVGTVLRKFSLDELPQIFNILKGDMSFIGPRPTLRYQVEKYDDFQRRRLLMKPGISGWAQVNGRNSIPWVKRIELDVWYVENYSLLLDVKILIKTLPALFKTGDVYGASDEISKMDG